MMHVQMAEDEIVFNAKFDGVVYEVDTDTYLLVDGAGNEVVAVMVDEETIFDATANDIRLGKVAATEKGVTTGTKEIPSYHTEEGYKLILNNRPFSIGLVHYDYTKLQAIICEFNSTLSNSVSAEKVSIENSVYDVKSTVAVSEVTVDYSAERVDFGIVNDSGKPYLIRYFMYKEIY